MLERVCEEDVSGSSFPFGMARRIIVGAAPVLALRIGYVGELGWELHIPSEYTAHVYETLWDAGREWGIVDVGYRTIESLRMEKGYLYWSADITPDYTPFEAGLGNRVHFAKKGDFMGRSALERQKAEGPARSIRTFVSDADLPLFGGETIWGGGEVVSLATSAAYGHTLRQTIVRGYLPAGIAPETAFEIEAFGERYPIRQADSPLYDPENKRLRS